ncbi:hypothetical protein SAMN06273572_101800 [Monaibacterium marinum]|uniref:Uncharacterized protein n=1 Tax=Pontivivens marinum TaxID=1690039 RepID=A0A2C9CRF0_9RHOB|nr:hypothetical protein [Monaibacterium marinum]SOH92949.1 hypothetical protein SAMN06273572_101800 [Monaibacterium marinum]
MSKANLSFVAFLGVFFALIAGAVWWNVNQITMARRAAAQAAPRLACAFAQWCVNGNCEVGKPADFVLITQGAHGRSYLRMDGRGGQLRGVFTADRDPRYWRQYVQWQPDRGEITVSVLQNLNFDFLYALQDGQEADIASASAQGSGTCDWIVEEAA